LKGWYGYILSELDLFVPISSGEIADAAAMRKFADELWSLAELACQIEQARWASVNR
jgi:hypothetical protein